MFDDPKFQLWMRLQLGQVAAREAELERYPVPDSDLKVEVRVGGRWTETRIEDLRA